MSDLRPAPKLTAPTSGIVAGAVVQKDAVTGQVRRVQGRIVVPGARTAREAADRFLGLRAKTLGLSANLAELTPVREVESLTATHITYAQVYGGLPVFGGRVSVHVDRDLAINLVNQELTPIARAARIAAPGDPAGAIQTALRAVQSANGPTAPPTAEAGVLVENGAPVTVWKVEFTTRAPAGAWEVMVNASTLRVLSTRNRARYVNGNALVFEPNPVMSSGISNLADNNDADSPQLNDQRVSRILRELDGTGRLQGTYATTAPTALQTRANESSLNFNYTRNDDRFEEVMAYYWITESQLYIQSLGLLNVNNRKVGIDVNGIPDDNSFYSPGNKNITFGTGGVDDAEDADIILHELGHAIQDDQVEDFGLSNEGGAMGEGFGDYWAASAGAAIAGPMRPAWDVFVGAWDGVSYNPGNPSFLRRVDSAKHYPEDVVNQVHADGEIWSACLWQIRGIVGRRRADQMILESHFRLTPAARFEDGARAILAVNDALGGADRAAIREVFLARGILEEVLPTFSISGKVRTAAGAGVGGAAVTASGPGIETFTQSTSPYGFIPDLGSQESVLQVAESKTLRSVKVGVDITHTWRGDLVVSLIHPDGTTVKLHNRAGGNAQDLVTTYPSPTRPAEALTAFDGKPSQGAWRLRVEDQAQGDFGTLNGWSLTMGFNGTATYRAVTAADGSYTIAGMTASTYTVTPTATDYTFAPASRSVTVGPDRADTDFTATAAFRIGGTIRGENGAGLSGVKVTAAGKSVTTGNDGAYLIPGLAPGTYTVVPEKAEHTFTPAQQSVTVGPSRLNADFGAIVQRYTVSGRVTADGAAVSDATVTAG
ncbi:MAG TPA: proprotein convertase P-domain-containing protein, partial [Armatimonadota bacterium]|nr:proprotein convertase P-domain-containing protein [Armatimonadota bacterium]